MNSTRNKIRNLVLAIDQGTTSTRCITFDIFGKVCHTAGMEFPQIYPRPGWVEHDPNEILDSVISSVSRMQFSSDDHIKAIGLTNQRETIVAWDRFTGIPLYNAIVWLDTRTHDYVQDTTISQNVNQYRHITGLPVSTYFSALKIRWLMDHVPAVQEAISRNRCSFGTIDSYLAYKLTGGKVHVTDCANASRYNLMDLSKLEWSSEVCSSLGIPVNTLPKIISNSELIGAVDGGVIPALANIPITSLIGDQHAALLGHRCLEKSTCKITYGTGSFMLLNTGSSLIQSKSKSLLTTVAFKLGTTASPVYALEGSIATAGRAVEWAKQNLRIGSNMTEFNEIANSVGDTCGVTFVPAFSGLFAPYWRDDARAVIVGMSLQSNYRHIARAILESTAMQCTEVVHVMQSDANLEHSIESVVVDGGMTKSDLLMQIQADLLNTEIKRNDLTEVTAFGAAYAAGLAIDFWGDNPTKILQSREYHSFLPKMGEQKREQVHARWKDAVERSYNLSQFSIDSQ